MRSMVAVDWSGERETASGQLAYASQLSRFDRSF
jgi:hypothetical protein